MSRMPNDILTGSTPRRRASPRLPCPQCRKLCPIEMRICTCGYWLISPSIVTDKGRVSQSPGLDVVKTREATSGLSSAVSRQEEVLSFREPTIPIEKEMDFTIPMSGMPKQMDEFFSLLTGTEPGELSEVVSSPIPTVPSESHSLTSTRLSAEPRETGEMRSNLSIPGSREVDGLLSSPNPTTPRELEDPSIIVNSARPNVRDASDPTGTRAVADVAARSTVTAPTELERLVATFNRRGRGEIHESSAMTSTGYEVAWKRNAILRIEKYLAAVALIVFVASLLTYWMWPFGDVSRNPEVTARNSDDTRPGSSPQQTVVDGNPGTKQGGSVEWQSFRPGSGDRSLNRRMQGSTSENSPPNTAAPNPSQPTAMRTSTEPDQLAGDKALPANKREKPQKKKVTVDDLITDKKKITVDDLINDN